MDRIIEVKVGGNHISKDSKNAGYKGEANVTHLRITFDEGWDGYAKEVTFFNAYGLNPVKIVLTADLCKSERVYLVPIPAEPLAESGKITFVIDGYLGNKIQRSMSDTLEVKHSPSTDGAVNAVDPTPNDVQQMQSQIETIIDGISRAVEAKEAIENMSVSCETLSTGEEAFVNKSEKNGVVNLHLGLPTGEKGDTGKSGVHIGKEPPSDPEAKVWIDTNGESGGNYVLTEKDKEEIANIVKSQSAVEEKTATLYASEWQGSSAPYSQTVIVEGMTAETQGTVSVSESATDEQYNTAAYASLRKVAQGTNSMTIKAYGEKPTVDIPLTVIIGG